MEIENLEKEEKSNWGGRREGSGRKPLMNREDMELVNSLIAQHGAEPDETDQQKRERLLILMDKLYEEGKKGNVPAIKEYVDRMMGKSKERIDVNLTERKLLLD